MADATTTNFADTKPEVGASDDTWGGKLNSNFDRYDDRDYLLLTTANYAANGGTADALTATLNPVWQSIGEGHRVWVSISADNTTGVTLAVDSTGVKDAVNMDGSAMTAGTLKSGSIYGFVYDGTKYRLLGETKATAAEAAAGTSATKVLTPASVAATGTTPNRVLKIGGVVFIWGRSGTVPTDTRNHAVSFHTAFPTACEQVQITANGDGPVGAINSTLGCAVTSKSASGFVMTNDGYAGTFDYFAVGY